MCVYEYRLAPMLLVRKYSLVEENAVEVFHKYGVHWLSFYLI